MIVLIVTEQELGSSVATASALRLEKGRSHGNTVLGVPNYTVVLC
jgi:hypothetical protein